jgi:predicted RecB family nuclease
MSGKITNDVLEARLRCRYKAHLEMVGERGEPHDHEVLMQESRERLRQAATAKLLARHAGQEVPTGLPLTADLLNRGLPLLLDAIFEDGDLSVRLDALVRVEGDSALGGFHYVPVLFHEAEKATAGLRLLLGLYGAILAGVQGNEPAIGILFHGQACQESRARLAGVSRQARRLLREAKEARTGPPPRLTLNDHCQVCEFRKRCHTEATAKDDLSLLRSMSEKEIAKYAKRGILTVTQLSFTFRPPRRTKRPEDRKVIHSHPLQALSIREKKVHVLGSPEIPSATKRIYLDLEGDPERGFCYLAGVVVREGDTEERHSFWIDSPADEATLLGRVLDLAGRHPDAWVYAYGAYEAAFLRRAGKAAGREEEVGKELARMVNVLSVVHLHAYFPVHCNGLKDIAGHLSFRWTDPDASGIQSVVWRRRWEESGSAALKDKLLTYNLEDCDALRRVTEFLYAACIRSATPAGTGPRIQDGHPVSATAGDGQGCQSPFSAKVAFADQVQRLATEPGKVAHAQFEAILKLAHTSDRDKPLITFHPDASPKRPPKQKRPRGPRRRRKATRTILVPQAESCTKCGNPLQPSRVLSSRTLLDFVLTKRHGMRKVTTRYQGVQGYCPPCRKYYPPPEIAKHHKSQKYGRGLKAWVAYQRVALRLSYQMIADVIDEQFGEIVDENSIPNFISELAHYYGPGEAVTMQRLLQGPFVHADETSISIRGVEQYVWVFTDGRHVLFMLRDSREATFVHDLLAGYGGVLVSDFYSGYDSVKCRQQKCWPHLIRDINDDLWQSPFDAELEAFALSVRDLMVPIMAVVQQHGVQRVRLACFLGSVEEFYARTIDRPYQSELAVKYQKRFVRYKESLFTFLRQDDIPWHNNTAETAIRHLVVQERLSGSFFEAVTRDYLILLGLRQACRFQGKSFFKFLFSGETDVDAFR